MRRFHAALYGGMHRRLLHGSAYTGSLTARYRLSLSVRSCASYVLLPRTSPQRLQSSTSLGVAACTRTVTVCSSCGFP